MQRCRTTRHHLITGALGACTAIIALAGCATAGDRLLEPDRMLALTPGEHVGLPDGATLRYAGVRTDSRCPPAVQCVWAGEAEVAFEFTPPGDRHPVEVVLHIPKQPLAPIGNWQLQLVSLGFGAAPPATIRIHHRSTP
jgi:hypothetical protein